MSDEEVDPDFHALNNDMDNEWMDDEWMELDDSDDEEVNEIWSNMMKVVFDDDDDSDNSNGHTRRGPKRPWQRIRYVAEDRSSVPMTPCMMLWYNMYIVYPKVECARFNKQFQTRF